MDEAAGDELAGVGGRDVEAGLEFDEFAARGEAVEGGFELVAHRPADAEFADELLGGGPRMGQAPDVIEQNGFGKRCVAFHEG